MSDFIQLINYNPYQHLLPKSYLLSIYLQCLQRNKETKVYCPMLMLLSTVNMFHVVVGVQVRNNISMTELDGRCLPGDNDLKDVIVVDDTYPAVGCLPDHIGIRMVLGQFIQNWKAVVSPSKENLFHNVSLKHNLKCEGETYSYECGFCRHCTIEEIINTTRQ